MLLFCIDIQSKYHYYGLGLKTAMKTKVLLFYMLRLLLLVVLLMDSPLVLKSRLTLVQSIPSLPPSTAAPVQIVSPCDPDSHASRPLNITVCRCSQYLLTSFPWSNGKADTPTNTPSSSTNANTTSTTPTPTTTTFCAAGHRCFK